MTNSGKLVGLWIDHSEAKIVSLQNGSETLTSVDSFLDKKHKSMGGVGSSAHFGDAAEKKNNEKRSHTLRDFYRQVITTIQDAESIFVFGPGEAKKEFETEVKANKSLAAKLAGLESSDKMTDNQIIAKVKEYFKQGAARKILT